MTNENVLETPKIIEATKETETVGAVDASETTGPAEMAEMVDWYNPWQLLDTGKKTVISTIIGENADPRLVSAAPANGAVFDYSKEFGDGDDFPSGGTERQELWIDYVSDVGDGWNPTYSVAYLLAQEELKIPEQENPVYDLKRGEILIFGGDGVYPTATSDEYEKKLVKPYRMAFNSSRNGSAATGLKKTPHVFVLPGNHDWYDSLVAFQKIFCTHIFNKRLFAGGWRTRQERSYFALKLPKKWWLLGVDLQLSHSIDVPQIRYFESVVKQMQEGDKVIVCVPEPYWVKTIKYEEHKEAYEKLREKEESVARLEKILSDRRIDTKLYIAGDLHHYRRFESLDGKLTQKITAGGGGAFLHPTHDFDFTDPKVAKTGFKLEGEYPPAEISRTLDWKNLYGFILNSPDFGILTAIMYPLLAWLIHGEVTGQFQWSKIFKATVVRAIDQPVSTLTVAALLAGLIFFTDSNSKVQKYLGGLIHGLFHLAATFILGWLSFFLALWLLGTNTVNYPQYYSQNPMIVNLVWFACIVVVCGIGGYFFGSIIMGAYLFFSLHVFKRHDNEAFSALKIQDYKNFLRMHIDAAGDLTIYPIKVEKVGRKWIYKKEKNGFYESQEELKPDLIEEKPIVV
jgi:hypothetical protein